MDKEKDLLKSKVVLVSMEEIDLYELAEKVSQMVGNDSLPKFIAYLEALYNDLDCTIELARHFEALKNEYKELEKDSDIKYDLSPKKIKL